MPRPSKGPRLYLHPVERQWLIRDGSVTKRTGCGEADRDGAQKELGAYIGTKFKPVARESDPARVTVAEVLTAYGREHAPNTKGDSPSNAGYNIVALVGWWNTRTIAEINKATSKAYTDHRLSSARVNSTGTPRRELAILQAAVNYWHETHGPLTAVPQVTLPPKPPARDRWLDRQEAARLLAGSLGWYECHWTDISTRRLHSRWCRLRGGINRHLARFILLGLYTGSRKQALLGVQWMANVSGGWIDLTRGIIYRKAAEQEETKKRQPAAKLGRRILAHLRRWKRLDETARAEASEQQPAGEQQKPLPLFLHVVSWRGGGVGSVRTAWEAAVELAWLDDAVKPHVLRHTRATWMMQAGIDKWQAAGALGMSLQMLEENYGHHHPDWQREAAEV
ncbi:site-specific integrase [Mesorhizobium sp.]|uniref:site-specific integrase n=1 Tax=Mesorhizobium sp. TaxID=1871066 RepID=UPI000FE6CE38|nr:site-specific integrase [Mesorhizobium sp.]RWG02539.1 MAG: site-specific integrase [Mesorhizobium sp.]RWH00830.1 MAG: site-specific integrase [Mesorhizobium sp.]TIR88866.1 MAG: site-specific integrase [Mesorhizobium sp.]TIS02458.1 MAG: site-specific integrase [Mesorhizobium sp.]